MNKLMKVVGYALATIGLACVVKHVMHYKKGCSLCGWHKVKVEEQQTGSTVSQETKAEEEKKTGSRYGSNPIHY